MTTISQHLHATLPPDVLDKFLRNIREHKRVLADEFLQTGVGDQSMRDIIGSAFLWSSTPEGFEYWNSIAEQPWEPQQLTVGDINAQIADELNDEIVQLADPTVLNEPIQTNAYTAPGTIQNTDYGANEQRLKDHQLAIIDRATDTPHCASSLDAGLGKPTDVIDNPDNGLKPTPDPFYDIIIEAGGLVFDAPTHQRIVQLYDPTILTQDQKEQLADGIKQLIDAGVDKNRKGIRMHMLWSAFVWLTTAEGYEHWKAIYDQQDFIVDTPTPTVPEDITSSKDFHAKVPPYEFTEARNILDLSDMHKQIFIGKVISGVGSEFAIGCADSAVEEYRKYLKEKHGG